MAAMRKHLPHPVKQLLDGVLRRVVKLNRRTLDLVSGKFEG
jgi:hypothetical protein